MDPSHKKQIARDERPEGVRRFLRLAVLLSRCRKRQVGTAAINLALYAVLVVVYFLVVLQWLNEPLSQLFRENLVHYALVSVLLILGQGLILDVVASSLLRLARGVNGKRRE